MWDDALDRAIDRVACEMTAGDPHGDLRARVMERVRQDTGGQARSRHAWAGAMAAAAIVLVALAAYREMWPSVRRPAPSGPGVVASGPGPGVVAQAPNRPAVHTRARVPVVIPPSPIDALAPPPLTMDSLAVDDLSTAPLDVRPLDTITPMVIAPLGDEGDRR